MLSNVLSMRSREKTRASDKKIGYAVVGLGDISHIAVLPGFRHATQNSELRALVSSTLAVIEVAEPTEALDSGTPNAHPHRNFRLAL